MPAPRWGAPCQVTSRPTTKASAAVPVFLVLALVALPSSAVLAQGWYTGSASGAAPAGASNYAGWASATAQDGPTAAAGWNQQAPQMPYGQAAPAYGYGYPGGRSA